MPVRIPVSLALISLLLTSCKTLGTFASLKGDTGPSKSDLGLGMNDVSILFPNHQNPAYLAQMPNLAGARDPHSFDETVANTGSAGFIPGWVGQELANNLQNRPAGDTTPDTAGRFAATDLKAFQVASMRIDPCPNDLQAKGDDQLCVRQLRIIWQVQTRELGPFAMDQNIHTVHHLSETEFRDILTKLRAMHREGSLDTIEMPLTVQPVIQKEGPQSPYLKGALSIIHRYARADNTMIVALLRRNDFETWSMTTLSVNPTTGGLLQPALIGVVPPLAGGEAPRVQNFSANRQSGSSFLLVFPKSASPDSIAVDAAASIPNAHAFENPRLHNPLTTDCSSCHQAAHLSQAEKYLSSLSPDEAAKNMYASKTWNTKPLLPDPSDRTSLQMFSFNAGLPKVSPRVANETANVLDYLLSHGL